MVLRFSKGVHGMNSFKSLAIVAFTTVGLTACGSSSSTPPPAPQTDAAAVCPQNYVDVPADPNFGTSDFCIAKFEMKNLNGSPESQAADLPWSGVTRDQAAAACASKGARYSLPDNNHWMTVARNIESVSWNWGGDLSLQEYGPSRGVSNNTGTTGIEASTDDGDACHGAIESDHSAAVCDLTKYDVARRVHKLSNEEYVWDFVGNVSEWIADDYATNYNVKSWILNITDAAIKAQFGPSGVYPAGPANPTGNIYMYNLGYLNSQMAPPYYVMRGGGWNYGRYAGLFTAYMVPTAHIGADIGFRCMFAK
jgi:hypothetical protein